MGKTKDKDFSKKSCTFASELKECKDFITKYELKDTNKDWFFDTKCVKFVPTKDGKAGEHNKTETTNFNKANCENKTEEEQKENKECCTEIKKVLAGAVAAA